MIDSNHDSDLAKNFLAINTRRELAAFFGMKYERFVYHLYKIPDSRKYTTFNIPKRTGEPREISSPISTIKKIQAKLNAVLQNIYEPKETVHGFVLGRNIVSNARLHTKQQYVLNIDLENFFPSINFGRVQGIFRVYPFKFNYEVASTLAHICCFNKRLPQGAPTSPIISNLICAKLDSEIMRLAKRHKCYYSRYADDLTLSTSVRQFPTCILELIKTDAAYEVKVGVLLANIIKGNGFAINIKKTRLSHKYQRQEVTGLTVNKFPNVERKFVRQVRAMLNAWQKYGPSAAEKEYYEKYNHNYRHMDRKPAFDEIVRGKINYVGMVRGRDDDIFLQFCRKYDILSTGKKFGVASAEAAKEKMPLTNNDTMPLVMTEGKTDWKHLKAALNALRKSGYELYQDIRFREWDDHERINDTELLDMCRKFTKVERSNCIIFVFDRDNDDIIKNVCSEDQMYKKWQNNVYSFAIPIPSHREDNPKISIELYYTDEEIKREDSIGRRLFLSNEFMKKSGWHLSSKLLCRDSKIKRNEVCIIDGSDKVYDHNENNVAITKNDFANNILNNINNFSDFNFSEFRKIYDVINKIISC